MEKSEREHHHATNLKHAVGSLAHFCGISEAAQLPRQNAPDINPQGLAEPLYTLFPATTRPQCVVSSAQTGS